MDARAPRPSVADISMLEATFMKEGPTGAAPWKDAMAARSARGLLQSQQPSKDHDTLVQDLAPNLALGSSSLSGAGNISAESAPPATAPILAPAEEDVCPRPDQCDYKTDERSGEVSMVCTPQAPRPRTWAGVCPESMPFFVFGCILDVVILVCCINHFVKQLVWAELSSLGFWSFVSLVDGNVWAG